MGKDAIVIKSNPHGLVLNLDPDIAFEELQQAAAEKFASASGFFKNANVAVTFCGRKLTQKQERILIDTIVENSKLHVMCLLDEEEEHEQRCRKAIAEAMEKPPGEEGQFYRGTLRSGQTIETEKSIVIIGDIHPGAQVVSRGNIVVLGCCMGNVYAGAGGNDSSFVAALSLRPIQIRIADKVARSAIVKRTMCHDYPIEPKIAYLKEEHIQIRELTKDALCEYLG